jgi:hypothetical protein
MLHSKTFPLPFQTLPELVREKFFPIIRTEEQLLFVIHLTGPFLQRLHSERYMRPLFDLAVQVPNLLYSFVTRFKKASFSLFSITAR